MMRLLSDVGRSLISPICIMCWVMSSLIASYCGPFGTYDGLAFPDRILFWSMTIAVSLVVAFTVTHGVEHFWTEWPPLTQKLATILIFATIFTPIQWEFSLFWLETNEKIWLSRSEVFGFVLLIGSFVAILMHIFTQAVESKTGTGPALLARLPERACGKILSLRAQDHYVHVVTERGRFPLLMRFADAIAELDGIDGFQVHRSYWVAQTAIEGAVRRNGRYFVTLIDGSEVPISRSYRHNVESAGLL